MVGGVTGSSVLAFLEAGVETSSPGAGVVLPLVLVEESGGAMIRSIELPKRGRRLDSCCELPKGAE